MSQYKLSQTDSFYEDMLTAPRKVRRALKDTVRPLLRERPADTDHPNIKKLRGFKRLYRYRVSDSYRLVYDVDEDKAEVVQLLVGNRKDVYDRLDYDPEIGPGPTISVKEPAMLEEEPSPAELGKLMEQVEEIEEQVFPDDPLPVELNTENLHEWGVPEEFHPQFESCSCGDDLLAMSSHVPEPIVELVMNKVYPPTIAEILDQPVRFVEEEFLDVSPGAERSLESFLLRLDPEQQEVVDLYSRKGLGRPWMVRGGPGTGKSVIALYCLAQVIKSTVQDESRILFTTYTNSLVRVARKLIGEILPNVDFEERVHFRTINSLAGEIVEGRPPYANGYASERSARSAIEQLTVEVEDFSFSEADLHFLLDEIRWVILGRNLTTIQSYKKADRAKRDRKLGPRELEQVWMVYERFLEGLRDLNVITFEEVISQAADQAEGIYDYVFVDEMQDFSPVAFDLCRKLVKNERHIMATGDLNQSIYGHGVTSWSLSWLVRKLTSIARREKSVDLKVNHRNTREIWEAIAPILNDGAAGDPITMTANVKKTGLPPVLKRYGSNGDEGDFMGDFIRRSLLQARAGLGCAAVLCRRSVDAREIAAKLPTWCNAKAMNSETMDMDHPGVKIMTMHAAKGLQFPVVVVARVNEGVFPRVPVGGQGVVETEQCERRLFFVACSRAMKSLAVMTRNGQESLFIQGLSSDYWEEA